MKTKTFITVMFFSSLIYYAYSQKKENDFGIALAINSIQAQIEIPLTTGSGALLIDADGNILTGGMRKDNTLSFSIIPKYYLNDDFLIRFEFGVTNLKLKANNDSKLPSYHILSNTEVTNKILRFSPGFQWIFMKGKKIESYCGMTISVVKYNNLFYHNYFEYREVVTDKVQYWGNVNETTPGGSAMGIGGLAGFNIYLNKRISFGAESSSSALYYNIGGETISNTEGQVFPNAVNSHSSIFTNSYEGLRISKIISSFNISVWL